MRTPQSAGWRDWKLAALLVGLSLVPALAGGARLGELARGASVTPANARFFAAPLPVVLHILAVIPFSIGGAFQFIPRVRRHHRAWHRRAGYALVVERTSDGAPYAGARIAYAWEGAGHGSSISLVPVVFMPQTGEVGPGIYASYRWELPL